MSDVSNRFDVYVSGPLSNLTQKQHDHIWSVYSEIEKSCKHFNLTAYLPSKAPANPNKFSPTNDIREHQRVYEIDKRMVLGSRLIIAYVGTPSHGVGMEIEMASGAPISVILLAEQGTKISRIVTGAPSVIAKVEFDEPKNIFDSLSPHLTHFASLKNLETVITLQNYPLDLQVKLREVLPVPSMATYANFRNDRAWSEMDWLKKAEELVAEPIELFSSN